MDLQPRSPLVLGSPPSPLLPCQADLEPARAASLPTAAASQTTASSTPPQGSIPSTTTWPVRLCPACPYDADEWFQLRQQAGYWKSRFADSQQREQRLRQQLDQLQEKNWQRLYEQAQQREHTLQQRLDTLEAKLRILEQCLHGHKSEKKKKHPETLLPPPAPPRKRGQQPTNPAPPRRTFEHLPVQEETCALPADAACCPHCGAAFDSFPGTDDGEILEIEVQAYRRRYHRRRYAKTCACPATPALLTAPPPPKLIPKGYLGISVWVLLLLEKYAAYQPTYRFLDLLCSFGVDLPMGTVTDGLQKLVPLFEPLYRALGEHQRQEHHWHCDETRWLVFIEHQGKVGHNWSLWVFCSPEAVVFVLDPTRAHGVPQTHLAGATGIASVDRAAVYKAMAQVKAGQIVLSFCWAHVRRDFLEVLIGYATLSDWVSSWLEEIRELYQRNTARLEALSGPTVGTAPKGILVPAAPNSHSPAPIAASDGTPAAAALSSPPPAAGAGSDGHPSLAASQAPPSAAVAAAEQHLREQVAHVAQRRDAELQQADLHPACQKILTSLQNHWSGLTVFLDHPEVPLDNNAAERAERGPVVARKNYYGSGALWSGRLAAMLFSLLHTLEVWKLCPLRWLTAYLTSCAEAGGKPPEQAEAFLPWNLTCAQKQHWALPCSQEPGAANTS
jgi:transposase